MGECELTATDRPVVSNVLRHRGVAGQYSVSAVVRYPGEGPRLVSFVAHVDGGPIVMVTETDARGVFVSRGVVDRLGSRVDEAWVRAFFA